jgi:hypothetical protein
MHGGTHPNGAPFGVRARMWCHCAALADGT